VKFKKNKNGIVPDKFEKISFGKNIEINEKMTIEDRKIVVKALFKLKKNFKLEYIISSLPDEKNYIFDIVIPREVIEDIPSFIRYQIEENVPMAAVDVNFHYYLTDKINKKGDFGSVVSVFPKQVVNLYTDIFSEANLFPISFFAESAAISHSLVKEGDKDPYLLLHMLPNRITVSIFDNGVIKYTSELKVNTEKVFNIVDGPEVNSLKETLNKVLIYWFTSKKDLTEHKKIENVLLVGHNTESPAIIDFFERTLKINVSIGNVWVNCFDIKKHVPEIDQKNSLDYATVIGLALRCINYA